MPATTETKPPEKPAAAAGKTGLVLIDKQIVDEHGAKIGPEHPTKAAGMRMMFDLSHPGARGKKATKHAADKKAAGKALGAARGVHDPEVRAEALAEAETLARKAGL